MDTKHVIGTQLKQAVSREELGVRGVVSRNFSGEVKLELISRPSPKKRNAKKQNLNLKEEHACMRVTLSPSCLTLCHPMHCSPARLLCPWYSPGKNTALGCRALLQGIFPTQGSNLHLLHCRQILYHLSHQGSPLHHSRKMINV